MSTGCYPSDFLQRMQTKQTELDAEHRQQCQRMAATAGEIASLTQKITDMPTAAADALALRRDKEQQRVDLQSLLRDAQEKKQHHLVKMAEMETERTQRASLLVDVYGENGSGPLLECIDVTSAKHRLRLEEQNEAIAKLEDGLRAAEADLDKLSDSDLSSYFAAAKAKAEQELILLVTQQQQTSALRAASLERLSVCQRLVDDFHERLHMETLMKKHGFHDACQWSTDELAKKCQEHEAPIEVEDVSSGESQSTSGYNSYDEDDDEDDKLAKPVLRPQEQKHRTTFDVRKTTVLPPLLDNGWINRRW